MKQSPLLHQTIVFSHCPNLLTFFEEKNRPLMSWRVTPFLDMGTLFRKREQVNFLGKLYIQSHRAIHLVIVLCLEEQTGAQVRLSKLLVALRN